ncbi:hypothetical protein GPECTOR_25g399 [Gonium pectorale]|uniref:2'-5'-oligoadenylate synthetase 1 domain-containing protein n=1 Tax=Gonium pectorale TaxID=33097 RepID=A0A150GG73_GONPE|nr:hypothetical protein GPECTOR_25g399 [Gonium pectorale]|eukprot:KXZ48814.1 hypothetical protein GPECTOR_25g399 [Gonium pectorale]
MRRSSSEYRQEAQRTRSRTRIGDPAYAHAFNWLAYEMPVVSSSDHMERRAGQAIQRLHDELHRLPFLSIDRIRKGGSLGRRTLVAGNFDVDLLLFINGPLQYPHNWSPAEQLKLLKQVREWLRQNSYPAVVEEEGTQYDDVLQVRVDDVEVDILLVPNMAHAAGATGDRSELQRKALMQPVYDNPREHVRDQTREAGVAESHTAFVADTPNGVKAVVRLLKAWYKYGLTEEKGSGSAHPAKVPSVALELLALAAFQREAPPGSSEQQALEAASPAPSPTAAAVLSLSVFRTALRLLVEAVKERHVVTVDAGRWGCSRGTAMKFQHVWGDDEIRIIHPIDPTCNVARSRKLNPDWRALASEAQALLKVLEQEPLEALLNASTLGAALRRLAAIKGIYPPWQ